MIPCPFMFFKSWSHGITHGNTHGITHGNTHGITHMTFCRLQFCRLQFKQLELQFIVNVNECYNVTFIVNECTMHVNECYNVTLMMVMTIWQMSSFDDLVIGIYTMYTIYTMYFLCYNVHMLRVRYVEMSSFDRLVIGIYTMYSLCYNMYNVDMLRVIMMFNCLFNF
jgi:hypothetical protein